MLLQSWGPSVIPAGWLGWPPSEQWLWPSLVRLCWVYGSGTTCGCPGQGYASIRQWIWEENGSSVCISKESCSPCLVRAIPIHPACAGAPGASGVVRGRGDFGSVWGNFKCQDLRNFLKQGSGGSLYLHFLGVFADMSLSRRMLSEDLWSLVSVLHLHPSPSSSSLEGAGSTRGCCSGSHSPLGLKSNPRFEQDLWKTARSHERSAIISEKCWFFFFSLFPWISSKLSALGFCQCREAKASFMLGSESV